MEELIQRAEAGTRFQLLVIGAFSVISALLAAIGLCGVLLTIVQQRTTEIGVRMAVGAAPNGVFRLVIIQGIRLGVAGIVLGVFGALGLTRLMTNMLVGVKATDPVTFAAIAALLLLITTGASSIPAHRAASLDPAIALRED